MDATTKSWLVTAGAILMAAVLATCSGEGSSGCSEPTYECSWEDTFDQAQCQSMDGFSQCVVFVDQDVECSGNGSSWVEAKRTLREAVDTAACGVLTTSMCPTWQVWIKSGTHFVHQGCVEDTVRLRSNVELYGGFTGTETTLGEADPVANPTVVDGTSQAGDANVNNVLVGQYAEEVVLDGLTIRGGAAFTDVYEASSHEVIGGGGLAFSDGSLVINECTFEDNRANMAGAITLWTAEVEINGSTFAFNQSEKRGGAILAYDVPGFRIDGCTFNGNHSIEEGGGAVFVHLGSCEITGSDFHDNHAIEIVGEPNDSATMAGAVAAMETTLVIDDCTFTENTANYDGGAVRVAAVDLTVTNSTFADNVTESGFCGGGLSLYAGAALIEGCTFTGNRVEAVEGLELDPPGRSGGIEIHTVDGAQVVDCIFEGNVVSGGGAGVGVLNSPNVSFENCVFFDNSADQGAGMIIMPEDLPEGDGSVGANTVDHSTFASNTATNGGADIYFIDGSDGAGSLDITNSILWSQTEPLSWEVVVLTPNVFYTDVYGGCTGEGNIDADPLFVDAENSDFHLQSGSPCINVAEEDADYVDIEGNEAVGTPDMGAYEYQGE